MKLSDTINELIAIADRLDESGLYDCANSIDEIISVAEIRVGTLNEVAIVLKDTFKEAINNSSLPNITKEAIPEIFAVIDTVVNSLNLVPALHNDIGPNGISALWRLQDKVTRVAEGILGLTDDIKKLEQQIQGAGEQEKKKLLHDYNNDKKQLENLWQEAYMWRDGKRSEDTQKWKNLQELLKKRGR